MKNYTSHCYNSLYSESEHTIFTPRPRSLNQKRTSKRVRERERVRRDGGVIEKRYRPSIKNCAYRFISREK